LRPGAKRLGVFGIVLAKLDRSGASVDYLRGKRKRDGIAMSTHGIWAITSLW
jgi:hypothetical protein